MSVPLIHQFWAGKPMPERYKKFSQQWRDLNPGWEVVVWEEKDITLFPELQPIWDSLYYRDAHRKGIELYVQMADVFAYAVVARYGGVYVNCDMQPVQPLPELPQQAWASYENNEDGRIVNAAFGAPHRDNPFWTKLLWDLPERYFSNPTDEMVMTTGPGFLTDFAHANPGELFVYPTEAFNPVHWKQIPMGGDASDWAERDWSGTSTIAIHHWGHKLDGRSNHVETATQ